ncbi:hypothetical protein ACJ73_05668 [Blastomyces percursus]|uniref:Uncharacterized protein n=1 Tax=Blastomyces percursus TaxID=1658174 RepID=A0A1J9QRZ2_9EURO|nr:hypothetical protein ACJ73_05668 [Blastomyces percursus]
MTDPPSTGVDWRPRRECVPYSPEGNKNNGVATKPPREIIDPSILPGGKKSLAGISLRSFVLGQVFGLCVVLTSFLLKSPNPLWRAPFFLTTLSLFHFLEYYITARYSTPYASISAFLLSSNGAAYNIAHTSAMAECLFTRLFLSERYAKLVSLAFGGTQLQIGLGLVFIVVGQLVRSLAMAQAGTNFTHTVQSRRREGHTLVKDGTQMVLGNAVCFLAYAIVLWKFFSNRIQREEKFLMCQVRAHLHQPCGCKSHQLRVCHSYKFQSHVPTDTDTVNSSSRIRNATPTTTAITTTNTTLSTNNTNTCRCICRTSCTSDINLRTIPRFITICSKAFNPDIFSTCPSYKMHPEVIDPHPCSDHWAMLSDVRLFFGPPRSFGGGNDEDDDEEGEEVVTAEGSGNGGGQSWPWSLFEVSDNGGCPDLLRKNHLDTFRERYYCQAVNGVGRGNDGGDGDGGGDDDDDDGSGKRVGDGVSHQQESQVEADRGTSCNLPGTTEGKKGGWTFLDMFLGWMGS